MNFNRISLSDTFVRYCLSDSLLLEIYSPETVSRVTLAALGIGFQPNLCEWKNNDFFYLFLFIDILSVPIPHSCLPIFPKTGQFINLQIYIKISIPENLSSIFSVSIALFLSLYPKNGRNPLPFG